MQAQRLYTSLLVPHTLSKLVLVNFCIDLGQHVNPINQLRPESDHLAVRKVLDYQQIRFSCECWKWSTRWCHLQLKTMQKVEHYDVKFTSGVEVLTRLGNFNQAHCQVKMTHILGHKGPWLRSNLPIIDHSVTSQIDEAIIKREQIRSTPIMCSLSIKILVGTKQQNVKPPYIESPILSMRIRGFVIFNS